jgi:hypothetical protein
VKKVLITLLATGLIGSAVAAGGASASPKPVKCTLYGCWHN